MKKIYFLFGIHNHQPIGNFDHIFQEGFSHCYEPFIALLEKFPLIKASLHYSGSLLEWIESEQPEFLERIGNLCDRGQVEILGGGFYEPIFSILRERDIIGQIQMMTDFIHGKFKTLPNGIWLAERVWEPTLPRILFLSGLSYTLLDSTHFLYTGLSPEQIRGYYVTEKEGYPISIFPIDMTLRYTIPFEPPEKTIEYLRFLASDYEEVAVSYGDDGEKFGMWPGTYSWVFDKGWLEAFFKLLEKNRNTIKMATFSEYLESHKPQGSIYLPTVSYEEMMEWALPAEANIRYEEMIDYLKNLNLKEKYSAFIRGGYWNNFLVKYPESNQMHKKMIMVSEKLEQWEKKNKKNNVGNGIGEARRELYKAQCNCAYWHGLFGGLYLNYLRHAVYEHLINSEKIIEASQNKNGPWLHYEIYDFNKNLSKEILITGGNLNAYFSPQYGGSLFELDFKPCSFNLSNIMTRKMEAYHRKLKTNQTALSNSNNAKQPVSIHNILRVKAEGLDNHLIYDWYRRYSFLDHFLGHTTTLENFARCHYTEQGDFIDQPYNIEEIARTNAHQPEITFMLSREGFVWRENEQTPVKVIKNFSINDASREIDALYTIINKGQQMLELWFGVEFNFTLLAGMDPSRYYLFSAKHVEKYALNSTGSLSSLKGFEMRDEWSKFTLQFILSPQANVWRFPLETISQSEDGLEKTYQGSSLLTHWKLKLNSGEEKKFGITLLLDEL